MASWREIHGHYSSIDARICPWENYIDEELRPYYPEMPLRFRLNKAKEIPDTTREFSGVSGGLTPDWHVLPPIIFPKPAIDTSSRQYPKVTGGGKGPVGSDSSSDSWEEEDLPEEATEDQRLQSQAISDEHRLHKMRQTTVKGLPITVEIRASYAYQNQLHEAVFSKEFKVSKPPAHVLEPYQLACKQIEQIGASYQGGLPASIIWTDLGIPREDIEVQVFKVGQGIYTRYGYRNSSALDMANMPEQIRAALPLDWYVSFGTSENPVDLELTERMANITSQTDPTGSQYILPWQIHLVKVQLRTGELGTPAAAVYKAEGRWDDYRRADTPPMCAKEMPSFIEATTVKETQAILRFGRDSNWPIKITVATVASPASMISITYDTDWAGLESTEEGEISTDWCWTKFNARANGESLSVPPALTRHGVKWDVGVRKENNSIKIIMKEGGVYTSEEPDGPPSMLLFGPEATLKIRTTLQGPQAIQEMFQVLGVLYQGRYSVEEEVPSREWALVGSFGRSTIPVQYRLPLPEVSAQAIIAANGAIFDACLKTQNYDKGFDKFIRKFNREEEMTAVVAVESGWQGEHGWAVVFKQGPRRCLLLDTADGLTMEETMWNALAAWATFQPRHKSPRLFPGKLFYPNEASHIFQLYWDHMADLSSHPAFKNETPICQAAMLAFSEGLRHYNCETWETLPVADAPGKFAKIANDSAISRLRPIADGTCTGVVRLQ
jgi:hypothetical protein